MRSLAQFIMQGRVQAVLVAALGIGTVIFAWVSAAAVGLVTLRKGVSEGSYLLFWASIPALAVAIWGADVGPLTAVLGTVLAAMVLRWTVSWPLALATVSGFGLLTALLLLSVGAEYIETLLAMVEEILGQFRQQLEPEQAAAIKPPTAIYMSGLLGLSAAVTSALCLVLARWWQSLLYNPGGFGEEFQALRLPPRVTALLLGIGLLLSLLGPEFGIWAMIVTVPLVFAGFGLLHGVAKRKGISGQWLVVFYLVWLLLEPVRMLLMLLAVADSWMDFRQRLTS